MCGIIGYVGRRQALPILLKGLKKLEYRGYDSSGVGVVDAARRRLALCKAPGKIARLEQALARRPLPSGTTGISHTRWATHGAPNRTNAHPHQDQFKKILLVHNGIIENYQTLKKILEDDGVVFASETDTEVAAQLVGHFYQGDLLAAVQAAVAKLEGAFALAVVAADAPDTLIAVRVGSPLIIGVGEGEYFVASDVPAIADETRRIIYLKDRELAVMTPEGVEVMTFAGDPVKAHVQTVDVDVEAAQKQGFAHFMLKEIHEQPRVAERMIRACLKGDEVSLEGLHLTDAELQAIDQVAVVACGTAFHAGLVGKYAIERLAGVRVAVDAASEFRYRDPLVDERTLVLAISQSGETADTLAAVREARRKGARIVSICNVVGSSLARESDGVLYTHAGPEIGVASTKAYVAQLMMLYLVALKLADARGRGMDRVRQAVLASLREIPRAYDAILGTAKEIARIAKKNSHFGCFLFLGRNINFPSALEGALKLKEISYIPAEGYAAGEMKHGPIALIDEYRAVVCIAPESDVYDKMISNMQEIRARRGKIIVIATQGDETIRAQAHHVIYVPRVHRLLTPLVVALPFQLFAYHVAVQLGCDVDQPRNLAKSVTVE